MSHSCVSYHLKLSFILVLTLCMKADVEEKQSAGFQVFDWSVPFLELGWHDLGIITTSLVVLWNIMQNSCLLQDALLDIMFCVYSGRWMSVTPLPCLSWPQVVAPQTPSWYISWMMMKKKRAMIVHGGDEKDLHLILSTFTLCCHETVYHYVIHYRFNELLVLV